MDKEISVNELEELDPARILDLWSVAQNQQIDIYIHSPFCKKLCKYCVYGATVLENEHIRKQYYCDYLMKQISFYKDVIYRNNIDQLYFGGGTPNMMEPSELEEIFYKYPELRSANKKVIEVHPAYLTSDFIDSIVKCGFTNVVFGVQTFDQTILFNENRDGVSTDSLSDMVTELKKNGIKTHVDVIVFESNDEDGLHRLRNDLEDIRNIGVDAINVYPIYQEIRAKVNNFINIIELIKRILLKEYYFEIEDLSNLDNNNTDGLDSYLYLRNIRLFNRETSREELIMNYDSFNEVDYTHTHNNLLGIGSFQNKRLETFSKINDIVYIEINDNGTPKYYRTLYGEPKICLLEKLSRVLSNNYAANIMLKDVAISFSDSIRYLKGRNNRIYYNKMLLFVEDELTDLLKNALDDSNWIEVHSKFDKDNKLNFKWSDTL